MQISNSELRRQARANLSGKWGIAVVLALIIGILGGGVSTGNQQLANHSSYQSVETTIDDDGVTTTDTLTITSPRWSWWMSFGGLIQLLFMVFIYSVLTYGYLVSFLRLYRSNTLDVGDLFSGFRAYWQVLAPMVLMYVYLWLWTLLLIIPGIVKSYSYALTPFIVYDEPGISADAAITKSMALMRGHKAQLFMLDVSLIGWFILSILTLGIGFLFLSPYRRTARAAFYANRIAMP